MDTITLKHLTYIIGLVPVIDETRYKVIFQVTSMDEEFRAKKDSSNRYISRAGTKPMEITSIRCVELSRTGAYLRGIYNTPERDLQSSELEFRTLDEAIIYMNNLIKSLADWDVHWKWKYPTVDVNVDWGVFD